MRSGMNRSGTNHGRAIIAVLALVTAGWPMSAVAQTGLSSNYHQFEAQRRDNIARQLGIQEDLRAQSGLPSRLYPGLQPYSLEAIYAGLATPAGARSWGSPYVFEPWPLVPGDIYGRQFDFGTPTPLGHVTTYTSPNGYIYEPYYATPADPPRRLFPAPATPWRSPPDVSWPGAPAYAQPPAYPTARGFTEPQPAEEIPPPAGETLREF